MRRYIIPLLIVISLVGCNPSKGEPPAAIVTDSPVSITVPAISAPTHTPIPTMGTQPAATQVNPPVETTMVDAEAWQSLPIVPVVSPEMVTLYQRGLESGRNPNRFSKIGDCQNITTYYLAMFDSGKYSLGEQYAYLQPTIDHFTNSWWRESIAVKGGMNVAAVQNVMWTNANECKSGENPLQCELRVNNPSFAIISLEESWTGSIDRYDYYMREIVEYTLSQNVVPILATRAETLTQERRINPTIAQIAQDYDLPLWNFWAATAVLPNNGVREKDGFHLTEGRSYFDDPAMLQTGWAQRNLTALQAIDGVYRGVTQLP